MHEHTAAIAILEPAIAEEIDPRREVEGRIALGVARQLLMDAEAEPTYRIALERSREQLGEHDPLTARLCWELGSMRHDEALLERAAAIWVACAQPAWAMRVRAFAAMARGEDTAGAAYVAAVEALALAIGEVPALVDVLIEAALVNPDQAHALRERAIKIATETTGQGSQRTADALWTLAIAERDVSILERARARLAPEDTFASARLLHMKALFLDEVDREAALRTREEYLLLREASVGFADHSLVPLVAEIKAGWEALGRQDEAEAFLVRCRSRTTADSWVYRNLTYSIAHLYEAQNRRADLATLWRDFLAAREAACAPGSPELAEARAIVERQRTHATTGRPPVAGPTSVQDTSGVLAFANQMMMRGDPRGELTIVHQHLHGRADDPTLLARERELFDRHREHLLGPLAPEAVVWHLGYWDRVELDLRADPQAALLRSVLAHPSAERLRELVVTLAFIEGDYPQQGSNAAAAITILGEQPRPALRSLALVAKAIVHANGFAWTEGCTHRDTQLWMALPNLERLHLGGVDLVHALAHPAIAHLTLDDRPICSGGAWDLPALRSLDWSLAGSTTGTTTDTELALVDPVWTHPLPALRDLTLRGSFVECEGALDREDVGARLATLERLLVPVTVFGDDPIHALRGYAPQLRHLARLVVTGAELADPRIERLRRELPNLTITDQSEFDRAVIRLDRLDQLA